ncbi:MAG: rod shape-determining protein MreC [Clostridiaceae bacterium]|nr:rod shape-determining protein MreC [Clostridiaceae bacterium]
MKNKYVVALISATLLLFILMAASAVGRPEVAFIGDAMGAVVTPVQKFFYGIGARIEDSIEFFTEIKTLKEQNEKLLAEIDKLREENRKLQDLKDENDRLRDMLGLKERFGQFDIVGAQVIAKEPGNWFQVFTIDKGTKDGLEKNDVVITNKGVVGHIYEIHANSSKVISIIDHDSSVSALVVRTRDTAVVKGDLVLQNDGLCKMSYIPKDAGIMEGDLIETSGLGGIYPKGLLIGKIKEIDKEPHEISKYAIIEPAVDFKRLEQVFVIRNSVPSVE